MIRFISLALLAAIFLTAPLAAAEKPFRAGAFAIDITPLELPVIVNGGMTERLVEKVEDRLHARCLVLDDGTTQLAIVIVDSCMMPRDLLDEAKRMASAATKIPPQNMLIAATHTHSAPSVFGCLGSDADEKYSKFLPVQIAKGIAEAHARLSPAQIGWAVGRDDKNVASRRWLMKPGAATTNAYGGKANDRVMMHPGPANKNAIAATGIIDADVPVVSVRTKEGAPLAVLTNYSLHYVGAPNLSADYFAVVCDKLTEHLQPAEKTPFVALHSNGTSGDQWLMDYTQPRREFDRFSVGAEVAAAAFEAYQRIVYYDWVPLVMAQEELEVGIRQPNEAELAEAKKLVETFKDRKPKTVPEVYAREAVLLSEMPAKRKIVLQAIRLGELGIAAIPNEVFSSTGLQIKIESPTPTTFTIELANGAEGYIPPPKQHKLGGYETWRARSSCLEVDAEPKIRAKVLELLNKVHEERGEEELKLAHASPPSLPRWNDDWAATATRVTSALPLPRAATPPEGEEDDGRSLRRGSQPVIAPPGQARWGQVQTHFVAAPGETPRDPVPSPLSPDDALKHFDIRPGFKIELVASEPLIVDPVAFDWGFDGKLWVVEMHDYPNGLGAAGPDDKGPPGGRIKVLEDTNDDGQYDKATTFADKLAFPNGIMVLPDGGVLVTTAPHIVLLNDTDNNGQADKTEVLFSGFTEGNQQLRVNGLKWGLDGWIYCANGGVGRGDPKARIKVERTGELVDVGARDFRFSLDYAKLEPQLGMSQFGRNRDDFGNWFGCNNNTPLFHVVHDDAMLRRNPHLVPEATIVFVPQLPKPGPVFAISEKGRFWHASEVGRFTSANSAMIYRDRLLGDEFYGNFFVSEPVHNLVHREIVVRKGATFTSSRPADEQDREFLASRDTWFRPNMIRTGPDGALYISDMYREIIEHPAWIQPEKKAGLTFRNGDDRGRIWRVAKEGVPPRKVPRIDKLSTEELVALFDNASGELRDMAQRWIVAKRPEGAAEKLTALWEKNLSPASRVQVLYTLAALDELKANVLLFALRKPDNTELCSQAVRLARTEFNLNDPAHDEIVSRVMAIAPSAEPAVQLEVAYALRNLSDKYVEAFAHFLRPGDSFVREGMLSSLSAENIEGVARSAGIRDPLEKHAECLVPSILGFKRPELLYAMISDQLSVPASLVAVLSLPALLDAAEKYGFTYADVREGLDKDKQGSLDRLEADARDIVVGIRDDKFIPLRPWKQSMQMLGRNSEKRERDIALLADLLSPRQPVDVQAAALQRLVSLADAESTKAIHNAWAASTPAIRTSIADALLSREPWTNELLAKLESGDIFSADLNAVQRQRLLEHPNAKIKERAAKMLASSGSEDRKKVVAEWATALELKGDAANGKKEFTKRCASCHKWQGEGENVGPDLNTLTDRSAKTLLTAILDPNLAVEPKYQSYVVTLADGRIVTGMLVEETGASLTLADTGGKKIPIARSEIEELRASGKSLMPEGIEKDFTPQALADLLELLSTK